MTEESRKFHLAYHIKYSSDPMEEGSLPEEYGMADQMLIMAITKGEHGSSLEDSYSFAALDGTTGEMMDPQEIFQSWMVLAQMLGKRMDPTDPRKEICDRAVKSAFDVFNATSLNPYH